MSRMLAYLVEDSATFVEALGSSMAGQFAALSRLHSDGWGTAWIRASDHSLHSRGETVALEGALGLSRAAPEPAPGRLFYLRFASRGSAVHIENTQPFLKRGIAFQHNGTLAARERVLLRLSAAGRASLRGTTDSEAYFQLAIDAADDARTRRSEPEGGPVDTASFVTGLAGAVRALRADFPDSCLNAFALTADSLVVVHSSGTVPPPLAAFAERGNDVSALPPGHDDSYNVLSILRRPAGVIVTTAGVVAAETEPLPTDSIIVFTRGQRGVLSSSQFLFR